MFDSIYSVADLAVSKLGLSGIDWAALTAKGRGSVWDRDYITQYMAPAQAAMIANVGGMTLDVAADLAMAQQSYDQNSSGVSSVASQVVSLMKSGDFMALTVEVKLSREAVRYVISHAYQAASYGFLLHADETIQHSGMTDAEIATHADTCVAMAKALVALRTFGFYADLGLDEIQNPNVPQQPTSTSGLGIAPIVVAALTVVAIVALVMLAWIIVSIVDLIQKNATVAKICEQATTTGNTALSQQCINTLTDPNKNAGTQIPDAFKNILRASAPYALAGVAVYVLYLSAPYIVKELFTKKASA